MKPAVIYPSIKSIQFMSNSILFVHLDNDRMFMVPWEKFPVLKNLSDEQKLEFEIIDDKYLSFLSIDEVFNIEDLIGIQ